MTTTSDPPPATRRAAIGVSDPERAGRLAHELARRAFVPVLAFTREQVLDAARDPGMAILVVDLALAGPKSHTFPRILGERSAAPMLLLSEARLAVVDLADAHRQIHMHTDTPPTELATAADTLARAFADVGPSSTVVWGPLHLELRTRTCTFRGTDLTLTQHQFRLLTVLARARSAVVSREEIHGYVFGSEAVDDCERITAHVRRIRTKVEVDPSRPAFLLTARGEGFRLADVDVDGTLCGASDPRDEIVLEPRPNARPARSHRRPQRTPSVA